MRAVICRYLLVAPCLITSCGWQARNGVKLDVAPSVTAIRPSSTESTETHTYFGAEFGAQQDALHDAPIEPHVQAF